MCKRPITLVLSCTEQSGNLALKEGFRVDSGFPVGTLSLLCTQQIWILEYLVSTNYVNFMQMCQTCLVQTRILRKLRQHLKWVKL